MLDDSYEAKAFEMDIAGRLIPDRKQILMVFFPVLGMFLSPQMTARL
jgi:hypothetical protein